MLNKARHGLVVDSSPAWPTGASRPANPPALEVS